MRDIELYKIRDVLGADFGSDEAPIVQNLLYPGEIVLFVAKQKSGKTIWTTQMAWSAACGKGVVGTWQTRAPVSVLYVLCEGSKSYIYDVYRRMYRHIGVIPSEYTLVRVPHLYLNKDAEYRVLVHLVEELHPAILVLDPMNKFHAGTLRDDDSVGETFARIIELGMTHKHVTVIPHHEHRAKTTMFGQRIKEDEEAYFGSYHFGADSNVAYGLAFDRVKKKLVLTELWDRSDRSDVKSWEFSLTDTRGPDGALGFTPVPRNALVARLAEFDGKSQQFVADALGLHHQEVARLLTRLAEEGTIALVSQGGSVIVEVRRERA